MKALEYLVLIAVLQNEAFSGSWLAQRHWSRKDKGRRGVRMALVDERLSRTRDVPKPSEILVIKFQCFQNFVIIICIHIYIERERA